MENSNDTKKRGFAFKLILNLLAMVAIGAILVVIALFWLDSWTEHGKVAIVPDVKGNNYAEALSRLHSDGFDVELSDSVYNRHSRPGVVVEQNPKVGTKVKPGRTIYLTINAFTPKTVTIPSLTDISARQARSILEGLGIENIREVTVPSDFRDLVISVKRGESQLLPGARIPVTSTVTLEIGDGNVAGDSLATSAVIDNELELP